MKVCISKSTLATNTTRRKMKTEILHCNKTKPNQNGDKTRVISTFEDEHNIVKFISCIKNFDI